MHIVMHAYFKNTVSKAWASSFLPEQATASGSTQRFLLFVGMIIE